MPLGSHTTARKTHLLAVIEQYDISINPAPDAIFSFDFSTLMIWCMTTDNPGGLWERFPWRRDSLSRLTKQDAVGLAQAMLIYSESAQDIIGFSLQTRASRLAARGLLPRKEIENRPEDVAWATQKLVWLWAQAFPTEPPPYIELEWDRDKPKVDFSDMY
jgi:hypothetical protein